MNDPQVWTLIGVFAAVMLGGMTLMTTQFSRVIRAEIGGLRGEMRGEIGGLRGEVRAEIGGLRGEMNARFEAQDARIEALRTEMNARFEAQDVKFVALDKEVASLATRLWGSDPR